MKSGSSNLLYTDLFAFHDRNVMSPPSGLLSPLSYASMSAPLSPWGPGTQSCSRCGSLQSHPHFKVILGYIQLTVHVKAVPHQLDPRSLRQAALHDWLQSPSAILHGRGELLMDTARCTTQQMRAIKDCIQIFLVQKTCYDWSWFASSKSAKTMHFRSSLAI